MFPAFTKIHRTIGLAKRESLTWNKISALAKSVKESPEPHIPSNAAELCAVWCCSELQAANEHEHSSSRAGGNATHVNDHICVTACYQQGPFLGHIFAAEDNDFLEETRQRCFGEASNGEVGGSERHCGRSSICVTPSR